MLLRTLKFFDDQSRMQYSFIQSSVVLFVISYQLWEIIGLVNLFGTGVTVCCRDTIYFICNKASRVCI